MTSRRVLMIPFDLVDDDNAIKVLSAVATMFRDDADAADYSKDVERAAELRDLAKRISRIRREYYTVQKVHRV